MAEYLLKRFALTLLTLFFIMLASYYLLRLAPGEPMRSSILGGDNSQATSSDNSIKPENQSLRQSLHLDKPIYVGFFLWLKNALQGDFGNSAVVDPGKPVLQIITEHLPVTLKLNFFSIFVIYLFALPIGVYAAAFPNSHFDHAMTITLFFLYSLPIMWIALLLQVSLCEGGLFDIFPLRGINSYSTHDLSSWQIYWQMIVHYTLPVTCLSYAGFAGISRFARASLLEVMQSRYITTARAKGLSETQILFKHALPNGIITLITLFGAILPGLISGSVIVEYIFNIPGMGELAMLALSSRDYPLQMTIFCFGSILTLAGILISDLLYLWADPRIRLY